MREVRRQLFWLVVAALVGAQLRVSINALQGVAE